MTVCNSTAKSRLHGADRPAKSACKRESIIHDEATQRPNPKDAEPQRRLAAPKASTKAANTKLSQ
jgi:hypothetical protein